MDVKTEQSKTPHRPGGLTEPFRLVSASSRGHRFDGIDDNTRPHPTTASHPTTPGRADRFPGLSLRFPRQLQRPRRCGHRRKQELLRGRRTYCFRGAGLGVKAHTSSCRRRRHQLLLPSTRSINSVDFLALIFFFFFLNMFLIARGLSKNGECSVSGTRNPAGVAAADTGHLPAWLDSSCLTVPLEQDARSCWQT